MYITESLPRDTVAHSVGCINSVTSESVTFIECNVITKWFV